MSSTVIPITKKTRVFTLQEVEEAAAKFMNDAQLMFSVGTALFGYMQLIRQEELSPIDLESLENVMNYVKKTRKTELPPKIQVRDINTPTGRQGRKTAEQLAHEYLPKLEELGLFVSRDELVGLIRGSIEPGVVSTIVAGWIEDEKRKGVEII